MNEEFNLFNEERNFEQKPQKFNWREKYVNLMKKYKKTKHAITGLLVAVFLLGVIAGTISVYYLGLIASAKEDLDSAYNLWQDDYLPQSQDKVIKAKNSLEKLQWLLDKEYLFKVPLVGNKLETADKVVDSSIEAMQSYVELINVVEKIKKQGAVSYQDLEDKKEAVALVGDLLASANEIFNSVQAVVDAAEKSGIGDWPLVKDAVAEFKRFSDHDIRVASIIYPILQKEGEQTFLLLMQNNRYLKPTGGYLGNHGILKIKDGEITQFYLRDTVRFDQENMDKINITPPGPIQTYFNKDKWTLIDAHWSPSFPLSAQRAQALFNLESDEAEKIDGVIAFSPKIVNDWMEMIGGVEVDGNHYDNSNFANTPQFECQEDDKACQRAELSGGKTIEYNRKYIINDIAQAVREELTALPLQQVVGAAAVLANNIKERNIYFYFNDREIQEHLANNGFSGELLASEQDFLLVIDTSFTEARVDQYIDRVVDYKVAEDNNKLIAELKIDYDYDYELPRIEDPAVPAYRDYVRVYVPNGAKLISVNGAMTATGKANGRVDNYDELGKTVFGAFITFAPGTRKTITFKYELPEQVNQDGEYKLVLQKQSGNEYTDFNFSYQPVKRIKEYLPESCETCPARDSNQVVWEDELNEDMEFSVITK